MKKANRLARKALRRPGRLRGVRLDTYSESGRQNVRQERGTSVDGVHRTGILLVNTGTTAAPTTGATRAYLREFLSDARVLDLAAPLRYFILYGFILPFRPRKSAEAYAAIWGEEGSPLLAVSRACRDAIQERFPEADVALAMRYGQPSLLAALDELMADPVDRIVVVPLFPQYASATTGSVLERVYSLVKSRWNVPSLSVVPPFFDDTGFLDAWRAVAAPVLEAVNPDHVLMSYHGLPERHVRKSDPTGRHCLERDGCCAVLGSENRYCYRAQCLATSRAIAERLALAPGRYSVSFQSRLGRDAWLTPATDQRVPELAREGVKRLVVLCPAFVADCLETLEEIGLRARESFLEAGGEEFQLVPCLNVHAAWLDALEGLIRRQLPRE